MIAPCLIINAFWLGAQIQKIPMICFHKRDSSLCFVIGHISKVAGGGGRSGPDTGLRVELQEEASGGLEFQ